MALMEDLSQEVMFTTGVESFTDGADCASTDKATALSSGSVSSRGTAMACRMGAGSGV